MAESVGVVVVVVLWPAAVSVFFVGSAVWSCASARPGARQSAIAAGSHLVVFIVASSRLCSSARTCASTCPSAAAGSARADAFIAGRGSWGCNLEMQLDQAF